MERRPLSKGLQRFHLKSSVCHLKSTNGANPIEVFFSFHASLPGYIFADSILGSLPSGGNPSDQEAVAQSSV